VIPVYADLMADFETPVSAYAKLRAHGPAYLLESVEGGERLSRYSFIGCRPRKVFACGPRDDRDPRGRQAPGRCRPRRPALPHRGRAQAQVPPVRLPGMPRFTGGAVGYISYEYVTRIEPTVPAAPRDELGIPLVYFMLSDTLLIFDRAKQTLRLCVNAHVPEGGGRGRGLRGGRGRAARALRDPQGARSLAPPRSSRARRSRAPGQLHAPEYESSSRASRSTSGPATSSRSCRPSGSRVPFAKTPLDLYRALRTVNPSPYTFILDTGDFALVGASPEVHVRLTDGLVEIRPIAGTRRRGATQEEDLALEKELLADEKERAEHLMLVDLARNDIGRVCTFGSIHVPEFMFVERYSHVMHIVSQVEGRIAPSKSAFDLMRATFPAGTVSGAPKVRAMQIIAEKEPVQRGFYAGALGYFGYDGNLDSCITLRTALLKDGMIHIQAGGGVVADSDPAAEYQETINKAGALLKAVEIASVLRPGQRQSAHAGRPGVP
jgi:anthranilate synthase component I